MPNIISYDYKGRKVAFLTCSDLYMQLRRGAFFKGLFYFFKTI